MIRGLILAMGVCVGSMVLPATAQAQFYRGGFGTGYSTVGPLGYSRGSSWGVGSTGLFGSSAAGARERTIVTPGGTTIQYGSGGRVNSSLFGTGVQGAKGIRITTPYGRSYTRVDRGGLIASPRGVIGGGTSVGGIAGPYGAAGVRRSGVFIRR